MKGVPMSAEHDLAVWDLVEILSDAGITAAQWRKTLDPGNSVSVRVLAALKARESGLRSIPVAPSGQPQ
jgi:hypothetical protein